MIVDPDFMDHWRTGMVADAIGDTMAPIYILRLWAHCQERKSDRFAMPTRGLKAQCKFPGDAEVFEAALAEAGFVERQGAELLVCGWAEKNASLIAAWSNGGKGGRPRKEPKENPRETQQEPSENPDQTRAEPIREEKRREEEKEQENPPASRGPLADSVCRYCRVHQSRVSQGFEFDHFVPKSAGGSDDSSNRVLACHTCNQIKQSRIFRTVDEAADFIHKTLWGKNRARYEEPRKVCFGGQPPEGFRSAAMACPDDVEAQTWTDFQALRKAKKAPLSETAMAGIRREAIAAGLTTQEAVAMCCARGWQGFKAEFIRPQSAAAPRGGRHPPGSYAERRENQLIVAAVLTGQHREQPRDITEILEAVDGPKQIAR